MEAKKISVIIPTYNRKEKLPACVDSVLAQTYQNIEVLVVDDASTDGTEELFREISEPRVKYLRYEENHGACYARNYGAERSDGELIAFQDSDDTWHPDKLEKQVHFLEETQVDMCFCGMNRIAANGNQFHFPVHPFHKEHAVEEFLAENRASTQTMLMKREVWRHCALTRISSGIRTGILVSVRRIHLTWGICQRHWWNRKWVQTVSQRELRLISICCIYIRSIWICTNSIRRVWQ